jgi:hypothetical protein
MPTTPGVNPDRSIPEGEAETCKFCGKLKTEKDLTSKAGGQKCGKQGCPGQMVSGRA